MQERFLRISRFLGDEAIEQLADKVVVIVGLGAVGGYCFESLCRSGVGNFKLVDFDTIGITNINRQILALESTIGKPKVEIAKSRGLDINPEVNINAMNIFAHEDTFNQIFEGKVDLVIDAIDSLNPKCCLIEYAYKNGYKVISSMGAALRKDPSLIRTGDLMDTWGCPLAKQVRTKLRRRGIDRGVMTVFSPEEVDYQYKDPSQEEYADFNEQIRDQGRRRNVLGSLPTVTGIFGLNLAHLALNEIMNVELKGQASFNPKKKTK